MISNTSLNLQPDSLCRRKTMAKTATCAFTSEAAGDVACGGGEVVEVGTVW